MKNHEIMAESPTNGISDYFDKQYFSKSSFPNLLTTYNPSIYS